jgi:tRNA 2-thiouridine synthesizing protein A
VFWISLSAPEGEALAEPVIPTADEILDCTGLACPLPVVKTSQAIKKIEPGQVLELLATDPGVEPDMQAWSRRTGNELLSISKEADIFHILIRRVK